MKQTTTVFLILLLLNSCNSNQSKNDSSNHNAENKATIETFYKHFNNHNWHAMAELYIDTPLMKDPTYGAKNITQTKAQIEKKYSDLQQAIPDVHDSIINMYHSGSNVIVEFESRGTAPDGSKFVLPICTIFEITNGKISKDLTYFDNF